MAGWAKNTNYQQQQQKVWLHLQIQFAPAQNSLVNVTDVEHQPSNTEEHEGDRVWNWVISSNI